MNTRITFLRHGETEANSAGRYAGSLDLPLNEAGISHARQAAGLLAREEFDVLRYGHKKRVAQTAQIVLARLAKKPPATKREAAIREMDFGAFEGLSYAEIEQRYPAEWGAYMAEWARFTFPGGDSIADFFDGCGAYIRELVKKHSGKNILVVAHKGFILCSYCALSGQGVEELFSRDVRPAKMLVWEG